MRFRSGLGGATGIVALVVALPWAACLRQPDVNKMRCIPTKGCPAGYVCVMSGSTGHCERGTDGAIAGDVVGGSDGPLSTMVDSVGGGDGAGAQADGRDGVGGDGTLVDAFGSTDSRSQDTALADLPTAGPETSVIEDGPADVTIAPETGTGGASDAADAPSVGGNTGAGGATGLGGIRGAGGTLGSGGIVASGGTVGGGGTLASGGAGGGLSAGGRSVATGGATGSGGVLGGSGSGGTVVAGGTLGSGGIVGTGGATGSGGAVATGGATENGGTVGSGGAPGSGGVVGSGGMPGTGGASSTGGSGSGGTSADAGLFPPSPSDGCGKAPTIPSSQYNNGTTIPIVVTGHQRRYILNVPSTYNNTTPYRLVIVLHELDGNDVEMYNQRYYNLLLKSNDTTIFAAPNGQKNGSPCSGTGNGDSGCGWPNSSGSDMALVDAVVAQIEQNFCVDTSRIFATGWSYGASMAYEVGCERPLGGTSFPWGVRGVAILSGGTMSGNCTPDGSYPVAFYGSHGTADSVLCYNSASTSCVHTRVAGGVEMCQTFAVANGCTWETPTKVTSGDHVCTTMAGCRPGFPVEFCSFNGQHTPYPDSGSPSNSWGPQEVWNFLTQL
jgi:poly(3-hydroxybutyrate) depolymerase